ncbi:hypothetical protein [Xanthobacter sediminis]|uniref:hypothetical protein n=1 Tax=Xanthobacter sediminis TaxID=3119926 RepID=UPI003728E915
MTMISTCRITAPKAALAIATAAFFMATTPGRAVELDTFLSGVEECSLPAQHSPLEAFVRSVVQRYGNAPGNPRAYTADRTNVPIVLPAEIASAFGPATTRNFGEYTQVTLPVAGTFGGLPLSHMTFRIGNRNGIKAFMLVFTASRADVVDVFGDSIEYGDNLGQDAGRHGDGYSAEIPFGEPGRIACDWSS